ncbi:MAG: putative oxidoreductase C-terminal domain-containing protein [Verrucomicrobiales bacterium]|nr:putative oxidoreductase C-terminal domain-containing protein [Verrucomicrobiota bacterium JB025]
MKSKSFVTLCASVAFASQVSAEKPVRLMTLEPGHFHAALVQKSMYDEIDSEVNVYSSGGPDLEMHLARIESFNTREESPTSWVTKVHQGDDFLGRMIAEKPGNVVVLAGNNARKTEMILASVEAGLNVLSDKPMAITPEDFELLQKAFKVADEKGVILYDIMTERFEISTMLQRELSRIPEVYGEQAKGTLDKPAVTKESVHHYFKYVAGKPLTRPWWYFDVNAQGEGIVDVATHLVDLIQWELFPGEVIKPEDVEVLAARKWSTKLTLEEFEKVTGLKGFPDELKDKVGADGMLEVDCNGEFTYKLRGVVAKVSVIWNYEAPEGAKDTHYSIMQGTKSSLVIRQGAEQGYLPTLSIEPVGKPEGMEAEVRKAIAKVAAKWPGVEAKAVENGWQVVIPDKYKVGHEAHFAQVMKAYLGYLEAGELPEWEVPNMIMKHRTIMDAYRMSR